MIVYSKASSEIELKQILELQNKNLPQSLFGKEKVNEGFVTVCHSIEVLKEMNNFCSHTIAKHKDKVVGYALSMTKDFALDIVVLKPMFHEISKIISDKKYIVMGQICIDKEFRGKGLFRGLYEFMKTTICLNDFEIIITEIDMTNQRSLKAHESIGFKKMKDYKYEDKNWRIVSLKV